MRILVAFVLIGASMALACGAALAQQTGSEAPDSVNNHLLVHVVKDRGKLRIVKSTVVPSALPKQRDTSRVYPWRYVVVGPDGSTLFTRGMSDPTARRGEFRNPDSPGKIDAVHTNQTGRIDFLIRLPLVEGTRIDFLSLKPAYVRTTIVPEDGYDKVGSVVFPEIEVTP
ncbi:MAG: hypothetical protein GY854_14660 [Deltaproteobacteria bacterium]|nr:hypothetical protein [Deltaproteobacteria bacterium]